MLMSILIKIIHDELLKHKENYNTLIIFIPFIIKACMAVVTMTPS